MSAGVFAIPANHEQTEFVCWVPQTETHGYRFARTFDSPRAAFQAKGYLGSDWLWDQLPGEVVALVMGAFPDLQWHSIDELAGQEEPTDFEEALAAGYAARHGSRPLDRPRAY